MRSGVRNAERVQQIPLIGDGMPRADAARTRDARRVHPAAAGHVVADARRRARQPGDERAARSAVEVDDEVVVLGAQPRLAIARSSSEARETAPAAATTITSFRCGLAATTGAAAGSTI